MSLIGDRVLWPALTLAAGLMLLFLPYALPSEPIWVARATRITARVIVFAGSVWMLRVVCARTLRTVRSAFRIRRR